MTTINTNFGALRAQHSASKTTEEMKTSITRLSTGLRLNSSADDAAGLAVSNKIKKQIQSVEKAYLNASNAISLIQTADSGLSSINNIIHRMNELTLQMSNGVYVDSDYDNAAFEFEALRKEVFRIVYNTKYNGVQLLDGTFDAEIMAGSNIGEELNLIIDGLRLESTITGRVDPIGGSLYELVNISRGTGTSNFDTPISAQAYGQTLEFQHPVGTATTSTASRYIGGGFQNGDFENVTITTSGTVDSFSGWEAHRQQVMLGPNPDILQSTTTLTANETTGTISADETVLSSIKTFSDLTTSTGGSFSLSNSGDGNLFTFIDNGDGTFDLTSGNTQLETISGITADVGSAVNGDRFSIDIAGTGTISTGAITGAINPGDYSVASLANDLNAANALMGTPAAVTFSANGNNLLITANTKGNNTFSASNFTFTDGGVSSTSGTQTQTRAGLSSDALSASVSQVDRINGLVTTLQDTRNGDSFSIDIAGIGTITTAAVTGVLNPGDYTAANLAADLNTANSLLGTPADVTFSANGNNLRITSNSPGSFTASNFQFTDASISTTTSVGGLTTLITGSAAIDANNDGIYEVTVEFDDTVGNTFSERISLTVNDNNFNPVPANSIASGTSVSDIEYGIIGGFLTPTDTTPNPVNPNNNAQISAGDGNAAPGANLNFQITGGMARLFSNMVIPNGDVVHGPYLISDNSVSLTVGDDVEFDFRAMGGGDAYDVYAYLLETSTGNTIELLNETGVGNSDTGIINVSNRVTTSGNYKFVFVSGTFDETFGTVAGASLYVDNVDVVRNSAVSAVNAMIYNSEVDLTVQESTTVNIAAELLAKLDEYAVSDGKLGTYQIVASGPDHTKFTIDAQGNISSVVPIEFFAPTTQLTFDVTYTSADLSVTITETVRLEVTETFDAEGVFNIKETGQGTISGTDLDLASNIAAADSFSGSFSLTSASGDHNFFSIDSSGNITSNTPLEYNTKQQYIFNAVYTTSYSTVVTERITLNILDTLSSTTTMSAEEANLVLIESQELTSLQQYASKDGYQGGYRLGNGAHNNFFNITSNGEIQSKAEVRIEPLNSFNLEAIYEDIHGNVFSDNITLNITPTSLRRSRTDLEISEGSLIELEPGRLPNIYNYAQNDGMTGRFELLSSAYNPEDYKLFETTVAGRLIGDTMFDYESGKIHYSLIMRYINGAGTEFYDEEIHIFVEDNPLDNNILTFEEVNISNLLNATEGQLVLSEVLNRINLARSKLGATESRLSYNLSTLNFSLLQSELTIGRIIDADYAKESADMAKFLILNDAATAMLSYANTRNSNIQTLIELI